MNFTGERATLGNMPGRIRIAQEHIARYNFALGILEQHGCKTVLDAACGTGYGTWLLSQNGFDTFGVDIDSRAIADAIKINAMTGADFTSGSLDDPEEILELVGRTFDAIVSFETIEHLEFPGKYLEWVKTKSNLLIFSLPIEQPSDFHKQVYSVTQAMDQIKRHFSQTEFLAQVYMNFYKAGDDAQYLVGYAKA